MTELKPCPFCGATFEIWCDKHRTWALARHRPECFFPSEHNHEIPEYDFDAWNTRAERTTPMYRDNHGIWHCENCEHGADIWTGSNGALDAWEDSWAPNYCPNCGAKVVDR